MNGNLRQNVLDYFCDHRASNRQKNNIHMYSTLFEAINNGFRWLGK